MKLRALFLLAVFGTFSNDNGMAAPASPPAAFDESPLAPAPPATLQSPVSSVQPAGPPGAASLSLVAAQSRALKNRPRLAAEQIRAEAAARAVGERRAAYFPQLTGHLTAVEANGDTAVAAGAITTSSVSTRVAAGFSLTQLVSDFGRARGLVRSSRLIAEAEQQHSENVRQQILRDVSEAYFAAEAAESVRNTAQAVLTYRTASLRQLTALAQSQLKSTLDVQFDQVLVSEAEMAVVQANSAAQEARAQLTATMGDESDPDFVLIDEALPPALEEDVVTYVHEAIVHRPEVKETQAKAEAAQQYASAEKKLSLPTISLIGTAGEVPIHDSVLRQEYGAAGLNIDVPIFNGGLYSSRAAEAKLRAEAARRDADELKVSISRDVRTDWTRAKNAYLEIEVAQRLVDQTAVAVRLAQARYDAGLGSIVELNQAELSQTAALITIAGARFSYLTARTTLDFTLGVL